VSEKIKEIILNIYKKETCSLTKLNESIRQHKVFLESLEREKNLFPDLVKFDHRIPIT
jgi:methyl coenzyme M reductase subunit C